MEITEFPQELQFEFLLDLPYDEIIKFCRASREALKICQSELFWNLKLKRTEYTAEQWGYPKPNNINIIRGPTPAVKYRILEEILNSGSEPAWDALGEGQLELFKFFLEDKSELFDPTTTIASSAVYNAAVRKYYDAVEMAWSVLDLGVRKSIFQDALWDVLDSGETDAALYLSRFIEMTSLQMLDQLVEEYYSQYNLNRLETLDRIMTLIDTIRRSEDKDIVQSFVLYLFNRFPINYNNIGPIVESLNEKFPGEVDVRSLIKKTLDKDPYTSWMSKYVI